MGRQSPAVVPLAPLHQRLGHVDADQLAGLRRSVLVQPEHKIAAVRAHHQRAGGRLAAAAAAVVLVVLYCSRPDYGQIVHEREEVAPDAAVRRAGPIR